MFNVQDFFGEEALEVFRLGKRAALREGFDQFGVRHMLLGVIESGEGQGATLLGVHAEALRDEAVRELPESLEGMRLATTAGTKEVLQGAIGLALNAGLGEISADHLLAACLAVESTTPPDDALTRLTAAGVNIDQVAAALAQNISSELVGGLVAADVEQVVTAAQYIDAPDDIAILLAIAEHGHPALVQAGLTAETIRAALPQFPHPANLQDVVQGAAMEAMSGGTMRVTLDSLLLSLLKPMPNVYTVLAAHGVDAGQVAAYVREGGAA